MRKYATTIRLSIWPRMLSAIGEAINLQSCQINKTDREIHLPNGSVFLFVGADDPQKLKSIEGVTDFWLEEANEFDEADFNTIDAGLSADVDPPCQIWFTYNPIPTIPGYLHWIQERFLQIEHELGKIAIHDNTAVLRTFYKHNAFCPKDVVNVLEGYRKSNPDLYKMWGLGEFVALKGVILAGNWDVVKSVPKRIPLLGYGLDFGFAEDPAAVIKVWMHRQEIWVKEILYATGLTNPELSDAMKELGMRKQNDEIIADSAEPKSIRELRKLDWLVLAAEKGPDYKRGAAQYLRSLTIHVLEGSPSIIKEFATWSWKQDKQGKILPIVSDGNDHLVDALIYRVFRKAMRWRPV